MLGAEMPALLTVVGATGAGSAPFPGGDAFPTDIDIVVNSVGADAHVFLGGPCVRLQHVGWWALGFADASHPGAVGSPTVEVSWWDFIQFAFHDAPVGYIAGRISANTLFWVLEPGASVNFNVSG